MENANFVLNLQAYLHIISLKKFNLFDYIEKGDDKLKPFDFLWKYKDKFEKQIIIKEIFDRMLFSLFLMDSFEAEKAKKHKLSSIAKERKNIQSLIKSVVTTKNIFDSIENKQASSRLNILEHILNLFEKDDEATIELICTAQYIANIIDGRDAHFGLFGHHVKGMENIIKNIEDLSFLASLTKYFDGYRLTKDMFLNSLAIKLFNYPIYLWYGEKFNLSELAKSVENLLSPFSENEKFRVLPSRAKSFYIKSMYKNLYILAYSGKKDKERFSYIFNPEAFYLPSKDNWVKRELDEIKDGVAYFESADDYHRGMSYIVYSTIILSR